MEDYLWEKMKFNSKDRKTVVRHDDRSPYKWIPQKYEGNTNNKIPEIFQAVTTFIPG